MRCAFRRSRGDGIGNRYISIIGRRIHYARYGKRRDSLVTSDCGSAAGDVAGCLRNIEYYIAEDWYIRILRPLDGC